MMKRIKIEESTCISKTTPTETQKLKQALRISQRKGLIRLTGDPSLDAPPSQEEQNTNLIPKTKS